MTLEMARASIGQQISNTRGVSQSNGPYLPPGSNFRLEFLEADNFGLSWPSPRGTLTLRLPLAALGQFVTRAEWLR